MCEGRSLPEGPRRNGRGCIGVGSWLGHGRGSCGCGRGPMQNTIRGRGDNIRYSTDPGSGACPTGASRDARRGMLQQLEAHRHNDYRRRGARVVHAGERPPPDHRLRATPRSATLSLGRWSAPRFGAWVDHAGVRLRFLVFTIVTLRRLEHKQNFDSMSQLDAYGSLYDK